MIDLYHFLGGSGSPSRVATSEDFCGLHDGKHPAIANAFLRLPAIFGKPFRNVNPCLGLEPVLIRETRP